MAALCLEIFYMSYPHKTIGSYVHNQKIGVLVEIGMFSKFTSEVPEVKDFVNSISMHIAACAPQDIDTLMTQTFIKDPDKQVVTVLQEIKEFVSEEIEILRFVRWEAEEEDYNPEDPPRSPANVIRLGGKR